MGTLIGGKYIKGRGGEWPHPLFFVLEFRSAGVNSVAGREVTREVLPPLAIAVRTAIIYLDYSGEMSAFRMIFGKNSVKNLVFTP